jgi:hypothetical protein
MQPAPLSSSLTEKLREAINTIRQDGEIERAIKDADDENASPAKRVAAKIFLATRED